METVSKAALCALVLAATIEVMADLRVWRLARRPTAAIDRAGHKLDTMGEEQR
jgi:hypothetical protein